MVEENGLLLIRSVPIRIDEVSHSIRTSSDHYRRTETEADAIRQSLDFNCAH